LNRVTAYDWATFLRSRLDSTTPDTIDESLENSGWKLIYNDQANEMQDNHDAVRRQVNLSLSIGLQLVDDGTVEDVIYDSPSYKAGMGPGMRITAVNGNQFSVQAIKDAVRAAKGTTAPIQLIVANAPAVETYSVDYHGGLRYAHLARDESRPDFLSEILRSQAP